MTLMDYLVEFYSRFLLLVVIDVIWKGLEILIDGQIHLSSADLVVGIVLTEFVYRYLKRREVI